MKLTWYGTACILMEDETQKIIFDPFCGVPVHGFTHPERMLPYKDIFRQVPVVMVTHGHFDHILQIPYIYPGTDVKIHCTKTPCQTLHKRGIPAGKLQQISPGFQADFGAFHITAYQGRHCRFDAPLLAETICRKAFFRHPVHLYHLIKANLQFPENGEILFYEITWHQYRIHLMGSMNLDPSVSYPTGADLLILPLQGRSDQDEYALQFVERLKPKAILLDHCDDAFPPFSQDVDVSGFIQNVKERYGIPCSRIAKEQTVSLEELIPSGTSPRRPVRRYYSLPSDAALHRADSIQSGRCASAH